MLILASSLLDRLEGSPTPTTSMFAVRATLFAERASGTQAADAEQQAGSEAAALTDVARAIHLASADSGSPNTSAVVGPEATATCPYELADGGEACGLLEPLGGLDSTPCDSLPLDARPLRLVGDANPAGYLTAHDAPGLACAWIDGGTYVAGRTIPAGDLRAVNATVWGNGACRFEVFDETGAVVASRADYEREGWISYALLRLHPGSTITTSGCGWVPAQHAGLGPDIDGVIGHARRTGRRYPLLVGVDVPPGNVRIECDYWAWPDAQPDEHGSWAASLPRRENDRRSPGPYLAESGVIWPQC